MMKPLPSVSQAYAFLIQEEKHREIQASTQFIFESAAMNVVSNQSQSKSESKKHIVCSHRKKTGHLASKCYRLVGFPKDFKFAKGKNIAAAVLGENEKSTDSVNECQGKSVTGLPGFIQEQYARLLMLVNSPHNGSKSNTEAGPSQGYSSTNFTGILFGSSCNASGKCICCNCTSTADLPWIIDTGASDHMCHAPKLFTQTRNLITLYHII